MKKIHLFILTAVLLLCGCSPKASVQNSNEDDGKWNLEANYSTLQNGWSDDKSMEITEDSILFFPEAYQPYQKEQAFVPVYLPSYLSNDEIVLLKKDASSKYSLDDPSGCKNPLFKSPVYYYKGKLYFLSSEYVSNTNTDYYYLMRCDIDGSNEEKVYTFDTSNMSIYGGTYNSSFIQFHNNSIYILQFNKFYYGNVNDMSIKEMNISGVKGIISVFFTDDIMYMCADEYNDGKTVHFNVLLECDLKCNIQKLLYEDKLVKFIDEKNVFYINDNDETYMINRETEEEIKILDMPCVYYLKNGDTYLLDTVLANDVYKLTVIEENGNILHQKDVTEDGNHRSQLYTENRLYVSKKDGYGYYEISDEGISDLVMLSMSKEE